MTAAYQYTNDPEIIRRVADNVFIPDHPGNKDWLAYLAWTTQGNAPDPYVPPTPTLDQVFAGVIASGIQLTWTISAPLNATYAIDPTTQVNIMAEMVSILANGVFGTGTTTRLWADINGNYHQFGIAEFKLFASAIQAYFNELYAVKAELFAGQSASWPSNQVSING